MARIAHLSDIHFGAHDPHIVAATEGWLRDKQPDLIIRINSKNQLSYSHFLHETSLNTLRLFKNKPNEQDSAKNFLVPEHTHFDFILMSQGEENDSNRLQEELKRITSIEWVAFLPLNALKSKDNFIF